MTGPSSSFTDRSFSSLSVICTERQDGHDAVIDLLTFFFSLFYNFIHTQQQRKDQRVDVMRVVH